jgi:N-acetylmuramic acid 6-phosphate etherase
MNSTSKQRSEDFLRVSDQFQLGSLTTEASHPITSGLSDVAKSDVGAALSLLFDVDGDVIRKYQEFALSDRPATIADVVVRAVRNGGRVFFTGCGSTGRLSIQLASIWRGFWQQQRARDLRSTPPPQDLENQVFPVMAGGDFALIKAVEGFEDFTVFGAKQLGDHGVNWHDVVFAITEGGETSFVIGTAWKGVEAGAKVYFVYNNPDDVLRKNVQRSREVLDDPRIEKINLTTGPMAITGSTRMQATSIQLAALLTIFEIAVRQLMKEFEPRGAYAREPRIVPAEFLAKLTELQAVLKSESVLSPLARLVRLEESVYRAGHRTNYFADHLGIDLLTDTTERSPTYCTPPFRKFDDATAASSWAFLFVPYSESPVAWERLLKRRPQCVEWSPEEVATLVNAEQLPRTCEIISRITRAELMRFRIGLDGQAVRRAGPGDGVVAVTAEGERAAVLGPNGFFQNQLEIAQRAGASRGLVCFGSSHSLHEIDIAMTQRDAECVRVTVPVPANDFLLDGLTRVAAKLVLNALSTCTMVRLGRVMGNFMIWVVPSNLKLIDRATRYIEKLTGLPYNEANHLLFEVIEYVEPRMKADQAYPPVVGVAVTRTRHGVGNKDAERLLLSGR